MAENTQDTLVSPGKTADNPKETAQSKGYPSNLHPKPTAADKIAQIDAHINGILALLEGEKIALTPEQRKEMPRMGPLNRDFARKTLEYLKDNPAMGAGMVNAADLEADMTDVEQLEPLQHKTEQIGQILNDRITVSGGEMYQGALIAYHANKIRADLGDPVAQEIDRDLKSRFTRSHKSRRNKD